MDIDFSNQSQAFPSVPSNQNPYISLESALPGFSFSSAVLANLYIYVVVFAIGLFLILLTFILNFAYSRKTSRPLQFYRCVSRSEGNYYAVENSTFIPFTQFIMWAILFAAMLSDIFIESHPSLLIHMTIRSQIPFIFMFLQAHGFACGMLVGAIVTWSEVVGKHNNSRILPKFFNTIQIVLALVIVVANLITNIKADNAYDKLIHTAFVFSGQLAEAAPTWQPDSPLDPQVAKAVHSSLQDILQYSSDTTKQLRNVWISWIFTCALPLAIIIISSAVILRGVRLHIKNMTTCGFQPSSNALQIESPQEFTETGKTNIQIQSATPRYTQNSSSAGIQRMQKSFKQLRDLERTLIFRITAVTLPAIAWSVCVIAIIADFIKKKTGGMADIGVVSTYVFPWMSVVIGSVIILWWFCAACKDWRNLRNATNRPARAHELLTSSSSGSAQPSANNNHAHITGGDNESHLDINVEGLDYYKKKMDEGLTPLDHKNEHEHDQRSSYNYETRKWSMSENASFSGSIY